MKFRTFLAAALAAGLMSFAAMAQETPLAMTSAPAKSAQQAKGAADKPAEKKPAKKAESAAKKKMAEKTKTAGKKLSGQAAAKKGKRTKVVQQMNWTSSDTGYSKIDHTITSAIEKSVDEKIEGLAAGGKYAGIIRRYATEYGVSAELARAVIQVESNYNVNARGSAGEIGLMQIKPSTARMMGYAGSAKGLYDPETNIKYGMKYLAMADDLGDGTTCGTILKYNAGHAATRMNPVSKRYCGKVLSYLE